MGRQGGFLDLIGKTVSHYRILEKLGGGGMGVVYKAEDFKLKRLVALKFLPEGLSKDRQAIERFRREAQAASVLNHPNICTIHDIDEFEDRQFIVMEFLEGQTLKHRIGSKPLPIEQVLELGIPIVDALDVAHAHGIVHRDIKPANLFVTQRGQPKILDFGLAKLAPGRQAAAAMGLSIATASGDDLLTTPGVAVGTMTYMSPEQVQGEELDARSDLFSFGAVLYEMATGQQAFSGGTSGVVFDAILNRVPVSPLRFNPHLPVELEQIIKKALEKDRQVRYQRASELRADLKRLKRDTESASRTEKDRSAVSSAAPALPAGRAWPRWVTGWVTGLAAGLGLALVIGGAVWFRWVRTGTEPPAQPQKILPLTSLPGRENHPALSPDGNQVAFSWDGPRGGNFDIYLQLVGAGTPLRLTTSPDDDFSPTWSPDGRHIAFLRESQGQIGIFTVPALGGPERKLGQCAATRAGPIGPGLAWSPDGKWLAIVDRSSPQEANSIFLLSVDTGEKRKLTSPPAQNVGDWWPSFSFDGKTLAFVRTGSLLVDDIYLVPIAGGEPKRLTSDNRRIGGLAWTPDSRQVVFSSDRAGSFSLWRISVEISSATGPPERLVAAGENAFHPSISRQGTRLAYTNSFSDTNIWRVGKPGPMDRTRTGDPAPGSISGNSPLPLIASTRQDSSPQFSPDGKRIAFASDRSGSWEIWVCDSEGLNAVQLTFFGGPQTGTPRWSPDGRQIVFDSAKEGHFDIYVVSAEGGPPRRLTIEPSEDVVPSWSKDGRRIYFASNRSGDFQVWKTAVAGGQAFQVTRKGGFAAFESPDGQLVYYAKPRDAPSIWQVPVAGGEETPVVEPVKVANWGYWAVLDQGIYFGENEATPRPALKFFSFATRKITSLEQETIGLPTRQMPQIASLEKEPTAARPRLAVSPDGRWILYSQVDQSVSDIMLVENFR